VDPQSQISTLYCECLPDADVAKLADAPDLGSGFRKEVKVQVLSSAPFASYPFKEAVQSLQSNVPPMYQQRKS
jgi:hypothetical protein